ncbi:hypothetical protein GALMADRAFT_231451 [Galerina marginata CBS 339.88]|uniref:Secreted protein n=1 Tax=Galerina marginata (strain CBS 339.88) TaxID=685588 RepID=A0A067SBI7_GALM3|nr:hypothetical protein GALMADRAFT_231451 [Galerina marginata CBS 339.88]
MHLSAVVFALPLPPPLSLCPFLPWGGSYDRWPWDMDISWKRNYCGRVLVVFAGRMCATVGRGG